MANLYEITARFQQLVDQENFDVAALAELDAIHETAEDKAIEYAKFIRNLECEAAMIKNAVLAMEERLDALYDKVDVHKVTLAKFMTDTHLNKITKCPYFVVRTKLNPEKIVIEDENKVPSNYWYDYQSPAVKKIDKKALKQAIDEGRMFDGIYITRELKLEIK